MKYYITSLSDKERQKMISKGLYCYDLIDGEGHRIDFITKRTWANNIGTMITNKEIKLDADGFADYNTFTLQNKAVFSVEELLKNNRNKDKEER